MEFDGVWCCEHKHSCKWQGFALDKGLAWGNKDFSPNSEWAEWHKKKCGGKLIQLIKKPVSQPACHPEELKKWIHFVWREMREQNSTVPDDVLDFIKEASLNAIGEK